MKIYNAPRRRRIRPLVYRLAARCPRCGSPPLDRIPARELARYASDAPDRIVREVKCGRPSCGRRYPIRARDYQMATPERG